ncbi:pyridoxal phosphate-dependent decarboxylase family protein [Faecalicatena contorta]|uniref:L-2,4-diaminobutyrate decarboxylase n=1 Tax=Faecalicatena contorta TaxID=39482 RepID=A0A315ZZX0_9FIRM|nr:aminotransferase class I/II-fold pyridoxal phosphate-dependent enzyme [Faecalicatena contorta]PWJ50829.1 L-2,4-diaminobutyrate decarboxylase [Faecalicatena contorta]SUQ13397.1 L-2,4-diaminobutyrate decarboxylase [Faecalicatena contorta]
MKTTDNILGKAYSADKFRKDAQQVTDIIAEHLQASQSKQSGKTIEWASPEEQLRFWQEDFVSSDSVDLPGLCKNVFSHSINFHSKGYMGHQVATTLPVTALTSAIIGYLNNCTTVYELGMAGNSMEKVIIGHLAEKFGYDRGSTGFVTSGGSLGNLTALVTARTSSGIAEKDYHNLAIMVSEEAHYSVERAAKIMGIKTENIIKVPVDDHFSIRPELLESAYRQAVSDGKLVFCVVGCACTTSVGAYDDLTAVAGFAQKHHLWFHVDGAHGGAVIFSDKYKHLLNGIEKSDSLILDFHKMMLVPPLSTAIIYNSRNRKANEFSPKAAYLWQDQQAEEWYNSARHTLECTKPITVLHTYAIMRLYGDEIYRQNVDTLYDLGRQFAEIVKEQKNMELALEPVSNIVCFRYLSERTNHDELNKKVLDELLRDGTFYVVSTTVRGKFYLRITLMNPLTDRQDLEALLAKIQKIAEESACA